MVVRTQDENFNAESLQAIGIVLQQGDPESLSLDPLRGEMRDFCRRVVVNEKFRAEAGSSLVIPLADKNVRCVVLAGTGSEEESTAEAVREAAFRVTRAAASKGLTSLSITMARPQDERRACAAAEGAVLAGYRFGKYLEKDEKDRFAAPETVVIVDGCEKGIACGEIMAEAQCWTRDIANEPGNVINPVTLAAKAAALADELGLSCEIWNEERIQRENMGAYYAVARGSANPPRFIHLTYEPKEAAKGHIVLVGKGLTFDSGGLDIKPADFMTTMKGDKSGACAVLGALRAAAKLELPWKVSVIIAAAENMPGGRAYRPDDILRARNGKTIEVNNTDAEGRLTLADALVYASELKPDMIVDIATLTGACAVALGTTTAGLFTNDDGFGEKVLKAGEASGERFWKLPMNDPNLRKQIKSPCADLVNSGGRYGGAITAAMFLEAFVGKDIPWVHLDIAAADFVKAPYSYYVKGASGFGARTLAELIREL